MKIYIGADHRGFELKETLKKYIVSKGFDIEDVGAFTLDPSDDYTLFAEKVALLVSTNPPSRGILLCGSGVGVEIMANKFDGIKAAIGISAEQIEAGRADDDMNVLVIAADYISSSKAESMINAFLATNFDSKKRHKRRLAEIEKIEENN